MSGRMYRRYEIIDLPSPSQTLIPFFPSPLLDFPPPFHSFLDLIQIETAPPCSRRVKELCDRVTSLESKFDKLVEATTKKEKLKVKEVNRKYSWTAEFKGGVSDRKYKWTAEIEGDDEKKGKKGERKYQWVTEIKGKDDDEKKTYTWKAAIGGDKDKTKKKNKCSPARVVEIDQDPVEEHRSVVLRKAFAKRGVAAKDKGKKKEVSPQDAVLMIQRTFRAYLIRRSKALRALRELAIAKAKLKELRTLFNNFSYRKRIARDAEERQKFTERIIVLLLTVDAIEGVDIMVRGAKRSMVDELEAMLNVVDPQPDGRSVSFKRRTFDMPTGGLQKEIAEGVAQVVQMIEEEEENGIFEACL